MSRSTDVASSWIASILRGGAGMHAGVPLRRPEKLLELYEFEACPFCRRVREALSELDLDAMIYPCPRRGRFREKAIFLGGKAQFPFLVDPNSGTQLHESQAIIRYLVTTYGDGQVPFSLGPLGRVSGTLASAVRLPRGLIARPAREAAEPLDLWSFEASPYCRIVKEALCDLELPYRLHNVAKKGAGREAFVKRSGKMMVPYLADPNTGKEMHESSAIVTYLEATYALPAGG